MRIAVVLLALGIILSGFLTQNIVVSVAYGASGSSSSTNASEYLKGVANRIMILLGVIAGALVAVLWVWKVVIPISSSDHQKKEEAKEAIKDLTIATLIIAMAVGGMIWLIFRWIAGV